MRINRLELRVRRGAVPPAVDVARAIARQCSERLAAPLPRTLEAALGERLAAPLASLRRK